MTGLELLKVKRAADGKLIYIRPDHISMITPAGKEKCSVLFQSGDRVLVGMSADALGDAIGWESA